MSELVYVDYLKELNNNLLDHSCNLNLDFEIGSSHVLEQLSVLEQYLIVNNLAIQGETTEGINNLIGFVELSEDLWHKRFISGKQQELKEIQKKNHLFKKGKPHEVIVVRFDDEDINEIEEELPELDVDLFDAEEQEIVEDNIDINAGLDEVETEESDTEDFEDDTDTPLLTDVFNDLQKAQTLFDEEDEEDYLDEYAIIEDEDEPDEDYPEDKFEQNVDTFDFGEQEEDTQTEGTTFGFDDFPEDMSESSSEFTFEQPQTGTEQRERVLTDAVVDKANEAINKGINALLKKIAK